MARQPNIYYRVDPRDVVVEVGGPWDEFALDNGGDDAAGASVLGTSLWSNITGDAAKMFTRSALDHARLAGEAIELDYFCDSPTEIRHARMRLTADADGSVLIEHRFVTEAQDHRRHKHAATGKWVAPTRCCIVCRKVRINGEWVSAEHLPEGQEKNLFFGYCDSCRRKAPGP
ncbi:MAG: hypothetical protein AAGD13_19900 [Pseudomonadota bacterium]